MPHPAADRLLAARRGEAVRWRDILPADLATAYAIQDATVAALGPVGGWKVGAPSPGAEPTAAPLPAAGIRPSGAVLEGPGWGLRGVEPEVALRLRRDLDHAPAAPDDRFMDDAFDAVLPVIEAVDTRLADHADAPSLAKLADLGTHGALILGEAAPVRPSAVDLATLDARVTFDGRVTAAAVGGHTAPELRRLIGWLVAHAAGRGMPLRAGQVVTTGSLVGLPLAAAGARVEVEVVGIGRVSLRF